MGKVSVCQKTGLRKGTWTPKEDKLLSDYILRYGHGNWRELPKHAGLLRCGKSCRLRWMNYLRPNLKRGNFSKEEDEFITNFIEQFGNRWSAIAASLPGRTDNEIKNYWHTHLRKKHAERSGSMKHGKPKSVRYKKPGAVRDSHLPESIHSLILESSGVIPVPIQESSDLSGSSLDSEANITENMSICNRSGTSSSDTVEFYGNVWTDPLLQGDAHFWEDKSWNLIDSVLAYPTPLTEEASYFYDMDPIFQPVGI